MRLVALVVALAVLVLGSSRTGSPPRPGGQAMQRGWPTGIAVECVNGEPVTTDSVITGIARGTPVDVTGWAVNSQKRSAAAGVVGRLDGGAPVKAAYGAATPWVAAMLHTDGYKAAGYHLSLDTSELALGLHRLSLYVLGQDGRQYFATPRFINVWLVPGGVPRPIVIGDGHHIVGSLDQVTTIDQAFAYGPENGPVWLQKTALLFLRGWAVDVIHRREIEHYDLSIDGDRQGTVHAGDPRPELAITFRTLPKITASYAGFTAIVPLASFPTGTHDLALSAIDPQTHERTSLLTDFAFATYEPTQLPKLVEPSLGPTRPLRFENGTRFDGSLDLITALSRARDYTRQALPVWVDPADYLLIRGWGLDVRDRTGLSPTYAIVDRRTRIAVTLGELRPDVLALYPGLPHAASARAGFSVKIAMRGLAVGPHKVTLAAIDPKTRAQTELVTDFPFTIF